MAYYDLLREAKDGFNLLPREGLEWQLIRAVEQLEEDRNTLVKGFNISTALDKKRIEALEKESYVG